MLFINVSFYAVTHGLQYFCLSGFSCSNSVAVEEHYFFIILYLIHIFMTKAHETIIIWPRTHKKFLIRNVTLGIEQDL